ncbi:glycosyltransferase family 2 protein [Sphingomonas sp. M1-B02]|uniref:glycosyltransferase family 2 protein n=1 Tax=Sphingomonas sp. M1-B02 TaxID=3114300 RepID=UPI00223F2683|nr:glycosyltransferase family 2 protein [Sphingomonas sp. S6-11]UZK65051.1 glycosyltransferase family 2 protein [Sphingomonas sp. S6-11]
MAGTVDIVIVNWNAGVLLAACLDSLAAADRSVIARIVVVDNGSIDGSADLEMPGLPLQIIRTGENLGFGRACNLGAAQGDSDYILLLNPDTEVDRDAISTAAAYLDDPRHADIGVVGIRLVDRQGMAQRHCARFPTPRTFLAESLGLTHLFPQRFKPMLMLDFDHLKTRDVDHVMGAFYCIRRSLFETLGGFDPAYFVYLEDLDLSRRVTRTGARIRYLAQPRAFHHQGGTSEQIKARRLHYSLAGKLTYARKHFGRGGAAAAWIAVLLIEPFTRSGLALKRRSFAELRETWQGILMLYRALPALLRSSRPTQAAL